MWRRLGRDEWQTLSEALDHLDGEKLYRVELQEARRRQGEREAAYREAQRPVCEQCGTKFTDERWQKIKGASWPGEGTGCAGRARRRPPNVRRLIASRAARRRRPNARPPKRWP
ncbi:hypothetical protein ABZ896_12320 [Streptomyces sp. NPDC047072]|uniref:hypothetical protein n=1 Tax=Streptomyces sp. NPDC047072 TaxID=3154809 RepID=UPI0033FD1A61